MYLNGRSDDADPRLGDKTVDSGEVGLADVFETDGMRLENGKKVYSNPNKKHSDKDTLEDGQEILPQLKEKKIYTTGESYHICRYLEMVSDPKLEDSDGDGFNDYVELNEFHSNPLKNEILAVYGNKYKNVDLNRKTPFNISDIGIDITDLASFASEFANLEYPINKNIETSNSGLINDQSVFWGKNMLMGGEILDNNGCGPISQYNALTLLGLTPCLSDILYEDTMGMDLTLQGFGDWGLNPYQLDNYYKRHGIKIDSTTSEKTLKSWEKPGTILTICYWNNDYPNESVFMDLITGGIDKIISNEISMMGKGAHYVTCVKMGDRLVVLNGDVNKKFNSISSLLNGHKLFMGFKIL